jgi:tetrahydromethanopterin S-methyltransferase subunit E
MATWSKTVRDRPIVSVLAVAIASMVAWVVFALMGPVALLTVAVLAIIGIALTHWYQGVRDERVRADADTFSFGDVVVRMQARQQAEELITTNRREALRAARLAS